MYDDDFEVVERLGLAGITLSASLEVPGGGYTVIFDTRQALAYLARPREFTAAYFELTLDQYETWLDLEGRVACGAPTRAGTPCQHLVGGQTQLSANEWKAAHGQRCAAHSGERSARPAAGRRRRRFDGS